MFEGSVSSSSNCPGLRWDASSLPSCLFALHPCLPPSSSALNRRPPGHGKAPEPGYHTDTDQLKSIVENRVSCHIFSLKAGLLLKVYFCVRTYLYVLDTKTFPLLLPRKEDTHNPVTTCFISGLNDTEILVLGKNSQELFLFMTVLK